MKIAHQYIIACFLVCLLFAPSVSQARECNAGMILSKTPNHPEGDCVPFRGKKVRMDITQGTTKMGKSTETYLKPSADNGPHSVQSKYLQLWLDATDPYNDGYRPADGSKISRWKDKSGNGRNAVQATVANQPTYSTKTINGQPAVVFDDASQHKLTIPAGLLSKLNAGQTSIFIVYSANEKTFGAFLQSEPRDLTKNFAVQLTNSAGNGTMTNWYFGNGGSWDWGGGGAGSLRIDGGTLAATVVSLVSSPAPFMEVYYRGARVARRASSSAVDFGSKTLDIGSGYYGVGHHYLSANIGEILIYNKTLTDSERMDIEQYLANKWKIKLKAQEEITSPILLLDAKNANTINYNGAPLHDDLVGIWKDTSGFDNHAAGYGLARPLYKNGITDPTKGINGRPALYFTGGHPGDKVHIMGTSPAEFATKSLMSVWPKMLEKFSSSMTTFIIASTPNYVSGRSILSVGYDDNNGMAIFLPIYDSAPAAEGYVNMDTIMWHIGGDTPATVPWTATNYGQPYLWGFRATTAGVSNDGTKDIYQNGVKQTAVGERTGSLTVSSPIQFKQTAPLRIAGGYYNADDTWKGSIGEIRIYNRALTDIEMCSCTKHLQNKWGTAVEPTACAAPSTCTAAGAATAACVCP